MMTRLVIATMLASATASGIIAAAVLGHPSIFYVSTGVGFVALAVWQSVQLSWCLSKSERRAWQREEVSRAFKSSPQRR
jgi:hypothetical protein